MLNRRSFLQCAAAMGLGLHGVAPAGGAEKLTPEPPPDNPNDFERLVAGCASLDVLGRPPCWSLVRKCFHPISPERVIVMTNQGGDGWSSRDRYLEDCLREHLHEQSDINGSHRVPVGKLDLIFRLMQVLTDHYRAPHLLPNWAIRLANREALGSTGLGHGFGL
jgi:hypothetical protein